MNDTPPVVQLNNAYVQPIVELCMDILNNPSIHSDKAIENMRLNTNTAVLGMIVFLLSKGYSIEHIIQRFIDNSV